MNEVPEVFPAYRLVAEFADGQRLTFDGLTDRPDRLPRRAGKGGLTMPIPESKRRNNDIYNAKCDRISARPIKPIGNAIRAAAKAAGQSVQAYVLQACEERMKREGRPLELDSPADE